MNVCWFDLSRLKHGTAHLMCSAAALLTVTVVGTPRAAAIATGFFCTGDCLNRTFLSLEDVEQCQQIALGSAALDECPACDCDLDGTVSTEEVAKAQKNYEDGCPFRDCALPTPTPTLRPDETPPPTATAAPSTATATAGPSTPTTTTAPATATATASPASTPTGTTIEPTQTPGPPGACLGDCDESGMVAVNELVTGVNIALDRATLDRCPSFDGNQSLRVEVNELVTGVNHSLIGCP